MTRIRRVSGMLTVAALIAVSAAVAQEPVYKSEVNIVSLGITVTNAREQHVPDLTKEDFVILEDGRPQAVRYFAADPTPLDLAVLLDTSGSMTASMADVHNAALQLANGLRAGDRASFTEVKRGLRELHPLSADTSGLAGAIRATSPGGSTALYDATYIALRTLHQAAIAHEVRRQALVILSDGNDTSSLMSYPDLLEAVRRHGVTIYAVSLRARQSGLPKAGGSGPMTLMAQKVGGDYALRSLAEQTGGRAFFNLSSKDLAATCRSIAYELGHQYSVGYVSTNPTEDGRFRLLSVHVTTLPGVRARTRIGYFASSPRTVRHANSRPGETPSHDRGNQ